MTATPSGPPRLLKVVSHSLLLYWWPVWLVGLVLGMVTWFEDARLATVPAGTKAATSGAKYELDTGAAKAPDLAAAVANTAAGRTAFTTRGSGSKSHGVAFAAVVLVVLVGTTVPMRGLVSVGALMLLALAAVALAYLGLWEPVMESLGGLHIQVSAAGYLVPSALLLALWLGVLLFYDPLRYMTFAPGQFVLHREVGDQESVYDTFEVLVEKRPTDYVRHWLLGFGAGDLIIKVPAQALQVEFPNVLFIDSQLRRISETLRTRLVINS